MVKDSMLAIKKSISGGVLAQYDLGVTNDVHNTQFSDVTVIKDRLQPNLRHSDRSIDQRRLARFRDTPSDVEFKAITSGTTPDLCENIKFYSESKKPSSAFVFENDKALFLHNKTRVNPWDKLHLVIIRVWTSTETTDEVMVWTFVSCFTVRNGYEPRKDEKNTILILHDTSWVTFKDGGDRLKRTQKKHELQASDNYRRGIHTQLILALIIGCCYLDYMEKVPRGESSLSGNEVDYSIESFSEACRGNYARIVQGEDGKMLKSNLSNNITGDGVGCMNARTR